MGICDKQKETAIDTDMVTDESNSNSTHASNTTKRLYIVLVET